MRDITPSIIRLFFLVVYAGVLGVAGCAVGSAPEELVDRPLSDSGTESLEPQELRGEVRAISGPGGLESASLPHGVFLGPGGPVYSGQSLQTPAGTLAELQILGGLRIRINESTALTLGSANSAIDLDLAGGEIVVLSDPDSTVHHTIKVGDETLAFTRGEVQIRHRGDIRRFAVIEGSAELRAASRTLVLRPGESIETPLPEQHERPAELSLAPLRDTQWSRTFEAASGMADQVPGGVGSLTARRPRSAAERQHLRLTEERVTVNISGRIAHTEVEQAFFNDRAAVLEGIYRFALPNDGSISALSLLVGDQWVDAQVVETTRGRQIFRSIVDATIPRDPALLEWERGNLFKLRIFPIPGRKERRVRLGYTQVLPVIGSSLRYRFPLAGSGATGTQIEHFTFEVTVDGHTLTHDQIEQIETPLMAFDRHIEPHRIRFEATREHFVPTGDLGLDIPISEDPSQVYGETHLDRDGQAYFMVSMRPELQIEPPKGPTSFALVLDRSHSMSPALWTVAQGIVESLWSVMGPDDRFVLLACDTACDQAPGGLLSPTGGDLDEVQRFVDAQDLAGASDLGGMLIAGAEALDRLGAPGERVIIYLGDGTPTSGEMAADQLAQYVVEPLGETRMMAVALGSRADLTTLNAIVGRSGGDVLRADVRDDRQQLVRELRLRARVPMAADLEIDTPDGMVEVHRHDPSGLRWGDSLVLVGTLSRPVDGDIVVRARGPHGPLSARFRVELDADRNSLARHRHLPRTWAAAQIAHLTQTRGYDARDEIIRLSKYYTVMSRFTSLLVLENDAMLREFNVVKSSQQTDHWESGAPLPLPFGGVVGRSGQAKTTGARRGGSGGSQAGSGEGRYGHQPTSNEPEPEHEVIGLERSDQNDTAVHDRPRSGSLAPSAPTPMRSALPSSDEFVEQQEQPSVPRPRPRWLKPSHRDHLGGPFEIVSVDGPHPRALARLEPLRQAVIASPTQRSAHQSLVRTAIRAGDPRAAEFAHAWADVDPDYAPALLSLADTIAATGNPMALRAYESALEIRPFDTQHHADLARAYQSKGDLDRSCSHRQAIVSLDPHDGRHHADLVRCLAQCGRHRDALAAVDDGRRRALKNIAAIDHRDVMQTDRRGLNARVGLHTNPQLRVTLTWSGPDDLDVAVVDAKGRRLSVLRPEHKVNVRETNGREVLTLARLRSAVFIEVTRTASVRSPGAAETCVRGELVIKTPGKARRFPVHACAGTTRVARIKVGGYRGR